MTRQVPDLVIAEGTRNLSPRSEIVSIDLLESMLLDNECRRYEHGFVRGQTVKDYVENGGLAASASSNQQQTPHHKFVRPTSSGP